MWAIIWRRCWGSSGNSCTSRSIVERWAGRVPVVFWAAAEVPWRTSLGDRSHTLNWRGEVSWAVETKAVEGGGAGEDCGAETWTGEEWGGLCSTCCVPDSIACGVGWRGALLYIRGGDPERDWPFPGSETKLATSLISRKRRLRLLSLSDNEEIWPAIALKNGLHHSQFVYDFRRFGWSKI